MLASVGVYAGMLAVLVGAAWLIAPPRALGVKGRRKAGLLLAGGMALAAAAALSPSGLLRAATPEGGQASRLDELMPAYHFGEVHDTLVQAPPDRVWAAIKAVRPGEIRLFLLLTGIRSLRPGRIFGRGVPPLESQRPILEIATGDSFVLLSEEPEREIVLGTCGQFWRARRRGRCPGAAGAREMLAFAEPGYAKAFINFRIVPEGDGCRVTTETRILGTDEAGRRRFGVYWRLIHPGSALLRHGWLEAIQRRAEGG